MSKKARIERSGTCKPNVTTLEGIIKSLSNDDFVIALDESLFYKNQVCKVSSVSLSPNFEAPYTGNGYAIVEISTFHGGEFVARYELNADSDVKSLFILIEGSNERPECTFA